MPPIVSPSDGADRRAQRRRQVRQRRRPARPPTTDRCGYGPRLPLLVDLAVRQGQLRRPRADRPDLDPEVHRGQLAARPHRRPVLRRARRLDRQHVRLQPRRHARAEGLPRSGRPASSSRRRRRLAAGSPTPTPTPRRPRSTRPSAAPSSTAPPTTPPAAAATTRRARRPRHARQAQADVHHARARASGQRLLHRDGHRRQGQGHRRALPHRQGRVDPRHGPHDALQRHGRRPR